MSTCEESIEMDYLLSLIQEREILWDKSHVDFKNNNLKAKAWEEVTKHLFPEYDNYTPVEKNKIGNSVVKKWRNVKDNFNKYLKKLKEFSKSGSAAKKLTKYNYYNQLLFLKKVAQNTTDSSLDLAEQCNTSSAEQCNTSSADDAAPEPSRYVPVTKKRTSAEMDEFEKETLKALKEPQNRHLSFFKGILPSIEDFTEIQTLTFQTKVLQLITEMRYGQMTPQSSSYRYEEQASQAPHGYQIRNYQSTSSNYINSYSSLILSPNQVSENSEDLEYEYDFANL